MTVALQKVLAAHGARPVDGTDGAIAHYGDSDAEYRAAREKAGLQWRPWRAAFRFRGGDRLAFLQRILSNDIHGARPGEGQRSLLLTPKGKVLGDLDLWVADDEILGVTATRAADEVIATLQRLVLRADVVIDDLREERVTLALLGPAGDDLLASVDGRPAPRAYGHCIAEVAGASVTVMRTPQLAAPGAELLVPAVDAPTVVDLLSGAVLAAGGRLIGEGVADVLRVEAGVPAHGAEITGDELPQELRLDDCIDYDKGCYVGQEPVARLHYRGHVNRLLYGLRLQGAARAGWHVRADGRNAGVVTSVAESPAHGPIGLGMVRRAAVEDGASLTACSSEVDAGGATPIEIRDLAPALADGAAGE